MNIQLGLVKSKGSNAAYSCVYSITENRETRKAQHKDNDTRWYKTTPARFIDGLQSQLSNNFTHSHTAQSLEENILLCWICHGMQIQIQMIPDFQKALKTQLLKKK